MPPRKNKGPGFGIDASNLPNVILWIKDLNSPILHKLLLREVTDFLIERMQFHLARGGQHFRRKSNYTRSAASKNKTASLIQSGDLFNGMTVRKTSRLSASITWSKPKDQFKALITEYGLSMGVSPMSAPPPGHWRTKISRGTEEYGIKLVLSSKKYHNMLKWIYARLSKADKKLNSKSSSLTGGAIYIPARPFIMPALQDAISGRLLQGRLLNTMSSYMASQKKKRRIK